MEKKVCQNEKSMVYTDKYENCVAGQYNVQRHGQKERQDANQKGPYLPH